MLLRVDVSTSSSGALLVTLSDQAAGFAPYRVDNCTSQTLHLRCHHPVLHPVMPLLNLLPTSDP